MAELKIVICDDEPDDFKQIAEKIQEAVPNSNVELKLDKDSVTNEVRKLVVRRNNLVDNKQSFQYGDCWFDDVDVLILDYDLVHMDEKGTRLTGEGVARLVRSFSRCGVIIVVNQFLEGDFDLGMRGHLTSLADINLKDRLLENKGLWCEPPWNEFRPWSWCDIPSALMQIRELAEQISGAMDSPVLSTLGLSLSDASRITDKASAFLSTEAETVEQLFDTTFKDFLRHGESVGVPADIEALLEYQVESAALLAVARIRKWVARELIGGQDVLIDLPHLVQRFPFVLGKNSTDPAAWNEAIFSKDALDASIVPPDVFVAPGWSTRPAVIWSKLEATAAFKTARRAFDSLSAPTLVFLEDVSRFEDISKATEYKADFNNLFARRYIEKVEGYSYLPKRRLAFGR